MCAASAEMDGRPGAVRDAVAATMREWLTMLEANINTAIGAGDLGDDVDTRAIAFRLDAMGMAANWQRQLRGDLSGVNQARLAWGAELETLECAATRRRGRSRVAPRISVR
jgi:Tetracyclin repressor-like, C-terminal domain